MEWIMLALVVIFFTIAVRLWYWAMASALKLLLNAEAEQVEPAQEEAEQAEPAQEEAEQAEPAQELPTAWEMGAGFLAMPAHIRDRVHRLPPRTEGDTQK